MSKPKTALYCTFYENFNYRDILSTEIGKDQPTENGQYDAAILVYINIMLNTEMVIANFFLVSDNIQMKLFVKFHCTLLTFNTVF